MCGADTGEDGRVSAGVSIVMVRDRVELLWGKLG